MNKEEFEKILKMPISINRQIEIYSKKTGLDKSTYFRWKRNLAEGKPY